MTVYGDSKEKRSKSPLWHKALERYREELEESDDYQEIIEIGSLEDLLKDAKTIESLMPHQQTALASMNRLGPKLKFVDDFSAIIAICFGADAKLTAMVWGSIRLLLNLASVAGDTFQDVLDMVEELSLTLPRFKTYEKTLPMGRELETALLDVYTEVICFYVRAITFFRAHPHALLQRRAWDDFRKDFSRTVRRIKHMSSAVESEADIARMRAEKDKYKEVLELLDGMKMHQKARDEEAVPSYYHIPFEYNAKFWGREDALGAVDEALRPNRGKEGLKSFALYGMGGIGKTQIALQYANRHRDDYNAILWIAADNTISLGQSFRDVAKVLGVVSADEEDQDTAAAAMRVKKWLAASKLPWLLIFDNADDVEVLRLAWPGNMNGSVLLTSRDFNVARNPASDGFHVLPMDESIGSTMLLSLTGADAANSANQKEAEAISYALGGLPLALNQIGGFISQRRVPLKDFLAMYERNAAKIDARKTGLSNYEHTVQTVWEMSLGKLSGDAVTLLNLLAFFDPDAVHETILLEGSQSIEKESYQFLNDEMDLGDAEEVLLQVAFIDKQSEGPILSMHRLLQAAVMRRLSDAEKSDLFDTVVQILSWGFPDTWSQDVGHQFGAWTRCEKCLSHVNHILKQARKYNIRRPKAQIYGELLLRCSWYLYERENYTIAQTFIAEALATFPDKNTLAFASATDLAGLIDLDMNKPSTALSPFETALQIRKALVGPDDPLIASSLNNFALAYTETNELERAHATHLAAIDIRKRKATHRIGNSYSNMASLLLKMQQPDEAEAMLKACPSLRDFTDETFLQTGNPRFSGDMVLLSRIRLQQGRVDDAMRLASKALAFRQLLLGNRLKTCDSMYDVAGILVQQGNESSAIDLLNQVIATAETLSEGGGQLARALYKLSVLYEQRGRARQSQECKERALEVRAKIRPDAKDDAFEEAEFQKLCLWMLW